MTLITGIFCSAFKSLLLYSFKICPLKDRLGRLDSRVRGRVSSDIVYILLFLNKHGLGRIFGFTILNFDIYFISVLFIHLSVYFIKNVVVFCCFLFGGGREDQKNKLYGVWRFLSIFFGVISKLDFFIERVFLPSTV